jgi:hypothetical protein
MNHSEGLPNAKFTENTITEAEITGQSAFLDAKDDIDYKIAEYRKSTQDQDAIRKLGAMLVGESDPSKQE